MKKIRPIILILCGVAFVAWLFSRPARTPVTRMSEKFRLDAEKLQLQKKAAAKTQAAAVDPDAALVRALLAENLTERTFSFATVAEACSGKKVLPLTGDPAHKRVAAAIVDAVAQSLAAMNRPDSSVRQLRRINEASRLFEDAIRERLDAMPGLSCDIPPTRSGTLQRPGYPDLRVTDRETGAVFYLDPKLVEQGSLESTFRSFYFEPKNETLKITDDAVHLLCGIEHDGRTGHWTFTGWHLADLSTLRVRLKAEFQASNEELYRQSLPASPAAR